MYKYAIDSKSTFRGTLSEIPQTGIMVMDFATNKIRTSNTLQRALRHVRQCFIQ